MASIFEEMMTANRNLTESVRPSSRLAKKSSKKVTEGRKISCKNLKVESRKFFEENDIEEIEQDFAIPEENDEDQVVLVIDPEIPSDEEVPEDAAEEMVGDLVYKCPVCGSNYVCDCNEEGIVEGIEVDEDGMPVECPVCGDDADQILVGEIAPAEGAGEEVEMEPVEVEDEEDVDDVIDDDAIESVRRRKESKRCTCGRRRRVSEDLGTSMEKYQKWVDYDMKHYGKISEKTQGLIDKAGLQVVKDQYGDYEVTAGHYESRCEDFDEIIDCPECDAEILELDTPDVEVKGDAPDVVIKDSDVELVFDETKLESMMTKVMKENYKGTPRFKVTKCSTARGKFKVEYLVRNNGKTRKGILVGEGFDPKSRVMKIAFKDKGAFTESFTKTPAFRVECVKIKNQIIPTKMTYDYRVKVKESLYQVKGQVGSIKKRAVSEAVQGSSGLASAVKDFLKSKGISSSITGSLPMSFNEFEENVEWIDDYSKKIRPLFKKGQIEYIYSTDELMSEMAGGGQGQFPKEFFTDFDPRGLDLSEEGEEFVREYRKVINNFLDSASIVASGEDGSWDIKKKGKDYYLLVDGGDFVNIYAVK